MLDHHITEALDLLEASQRGKRRFKTFRAFVAAMQASDGALYTLFERFTMDAVAAGRNKFGAEMVYNRMRWYTSVEARASADTYRLNNNYKPLLARLFAIIHPEHADIFEYRESAGDAEDEEP